MVKVLIGENTIYERTPQTIGLVCNGGIESLRPDALLPSCHNTPARRFVLFTFRFRVRFSEVAKRGVMMERESLETTMARGSTLKLEKSGIHISSREMSKRDGCGDSFPIRNLGL